jgi:hypothetical protein
LFIAPLTDFRQVVELDLVARDVVGIGDDAADILAQDGLHFRFPTALERLRRGDHHLVGLDLDGQDAKARGVGVAHHLGNRRKIDLQRIDVQVFQARPPRHPLRQAFEVEHAVRRLQRFPFLLGDHDQRVRVALEVAPLLLELLRLGGRDQALGDERIHHFRQRDAVILDGDLVHDGLPAARGKSRRRRYGETRSPTDNARHGEL